MNTDKVKIIAGRARHSVRAALCDLPDGGQRTPIIREQAARPANQSVFVCVHPWLKLKSTRTPAQLRKRIENGRVVGKQGNGVADARAQPAQPRAGKL